MSRRAVAIGVGVLASVAMAVMVPPGLAAQPQSMMAEHPVELPVGIKRVAFGATYQTKEASGGLHCTIKEPLPEPPAFPAGSMKIAFIIEVDPAIIQSLNALVIGDLGSGDI